MQQNLMTYVQGIPKRKPVRGRLYFTLPRKQQQSDNFSESTVLPLIILTATFATGDTKLAALAVTCNLRRSHCCLKFPSLDSVAGDYVEPPQSSPLQSYWGEELSRYLLQFRHHAEHEPCRKAYLPWRRSSGPLSSCCISNI